MSGLLEVSSFQGCPYRGVPLEFLRLGTLVTLLSQFCWLKMPERALGGIPP